MFTLFRGINEDRPKRDATPATIEIDTVRCGIIDDFVRFAYLQAINLFHSLWLFSLI